MPPRGSMRRPGSGTRCPRACPCARLPGCWKVWPRWMPPGAAWWFLPRATTSARWARWPWPRCRRSCARSARNSWRAACAAAPPPGATDEAMPATETITVSAEQESAIARMAAEPGPFLLFGSTGSGKTEVYLRCVQETLQANAAAQALVLVPEINLTAQLEERLTRRFAPLFGAAAVVSLHSGMTGPQRLASWLAAHSGRGRIVLGTRMAVFASLPGLAFIVVDEEHDPSYKQQEGARYSARDLAIWRGRAQNAKVLLGSATPSLHTQPPTPPADQARPPPPPPEPQNPRRRALSASAQAQPHRRRRAAPRAARGHGPAAPARPVQRPAAGRDHRARGARRAKHDLAQPPWLRPGAALCRLRLEKRLPPLQRAPGVPQSRPQPALPPLRQHPARAAALPRLRQPRHPVVGPGHRAVGRATGRAAVRRAAARPHAGAHRPHRRRHHPGQGRAGKPTGAGAFRPGRCAGRHADDRQGA